MPNFPPLDASVQWKISTGAIRFRESGYRATIDEILSSGLATEVVGLISAGKEADVYLARLGGGPLAIKVYRLYRTSHRGGGAIKVDNMAHRAAFEFEMLRQAWKGGACVPTPAKRVENMLAFRYLGTEDGPAPRLIDVAPVDPAGFQSEVVAAMERLVLAGVVHGDLSAFNILIHQDRPWFIDFSDSLRVDRLGQSPWQRLSEARQVLRRDLGGLASYFGRFGVGLAVDAIAGRLVLGLARRADLARQSRRGDAVEPRLQADPPEPETLHEAD